jgi:hypothetical protein
MTKSFSLTLEKDYYIFEKKPVLCSSFVEPLLDGKLPDTIQVSVSDELLPIFSTILAITKQGYYRWSWRFVNGLPYNGYYGVNRHAEVILNSLFPDNLPRTEKEKFVIISDHLLKDANTEKYLYLYVKAA